MFKVNTKSTRTTSVTSEPLSSVSIVDFEQVNVSWVSVDEDVSVNEVDEDVIKVTMSNDFFCLFFKYLHFDTCTYLKEI